MSIETRIPAFTSTVLRDGKAERGTWTPDGQRRIVDVEAAGLERVLDSQLQAAMRALAEPLPAPEGQTDNCPLCGGSFGGREHACAASRERPEEQAVVEAVRRLDFAWGTTGRWDTSFVPEVKAVLEALWAYDRAALARSTPAPTPTCAFDVEGRPCGHGETSHLPDGTVLSPLSETTRLDALARHPHVFTRPTPAPSDGGEEVEMTFQRPASYVLSVRLNAEESRLLSDAARFHDQKLSTYIKRMALDAAAKPQAKIDWRATPAPRTQEDSRRG